MTSLADDAITHRSWSGDDNSAEDASVYSEEEVGMSDDNNNESVNSYPIVSKSKYDESVKKFKKLFCTLNQMYPVKFRVKESVVPYYATMEQAGGGDARVPHLLLKPELKGSWLDPSDRYHQDDSNKIWNNISNIMPKVSRTTPRTFALAAGPACPFYSVNDPDLKRFLTGKPFKKIELDHTLFNKSSVDVGSSPHSTIDALLRKALHDSFINDELFTIVLDVAGSFVPHLRSPQLSSLETLFSSLRICAENNQRSGQSILAALVCNKVALRDVVLRRFSVPDTSRALLRGSDFKSDKLFGPLPESFRETLLHPMGNVYKCKSRNSSPSSSSKPPFAKSSFSRKRSSTSGFSGTKRFKPSTSSTSSATSAAAAKNFRGRSRRKR